MLNPLQFINRQINGGRDAQTDWVLSRVKEEEENDDEGDIEKSSEEKNPFE